jgi:hypothetical protein
MNDQRDNPYAAPRTPSEAGPPIPGSVFARALVRGVWAGVVTFVLAAGVAMLIWIMCTTWLDSRLQSEKTWPATGCWPAASWSASSCWARRFVAADSTPGRNAMVGRQDVDRTDARFG